MVHFNIVLHEPQIPSNTGNIGRTCAATGASLHLIEPLGFHLSEKAVKRAGMDYWQEIDLFRYLDYSDFCNKNPGAKVYYASTKAPRSYTEVRFEPDCFIMFGREDAGIPEEILAANPDTCIRIPMESGTRSLNLSNSVAVILYEALRQNQFEGLQKSGELRSGTWEEIRRAHRSGR